ncbi:Uncharacterised protein [Mycobacterium tuberculosis]|nr:Uncharacterised protein [Mycobacterium tuberculosis]
MEQVWRIRHVRIVTVCALVLAASAMAVVLTARTESGRACGCVAGPSCASITPGGDGLGPGCAPPSGGRLPPAAEGADHDQEDAVSLRLDGDGFALKLSFYRGLGGGVTSSFTRDGLAFTFEGGAGVGGSFSAGSTMGRPDSGLAFEARASMSSRLYFLRPPDFGLTLSRDGMAQGYMDAKAGNFRTRFRTRSVSLTGGGFQGPAEVPVTRRSWSLGTEFKLATSYTVRLPWGGLFDVWTDLFGTVPGRVPPVRPMHHLGHEGDLDRALIRHYPDVRPRRTARRAGLADRYRAPVRLRGPGVPARARGTRSARPRGAAGAASRHGPREGPGAAAPADEEPPEAVPPLRSLIGLSCRSRHYCGSAN